MLKNSYIAINRCINQYFINQSKLTNTTCSMKNKIEYLSTFLVLGLALVLMVKVLMVAIEFFSKGDLPTAVAFAG